MVAQAADVRSKQRQQTVSPLHQSSAQLLLHLCKTLQEKACLSMVKGGIRGTPAATAAASVGAPHHGRSLRVRGRACPRRRSIKLWHAACCRSKRMLSVTQSLGKGLRKNRVGLCRRRRARLPPLPQTRRRQGWRLAGNL